MVVWTDAYVYVYVYARTRDTQRALAARLEHAQDGGQRGDLLQVVHQHHHADVVGALDELVLSCFGGGVVGQSVDPSMNRKNRQNRLTGALPFARSTSATYVRTCGG